MSSFPNFSNIAGYIQNKITSRKGSSYNVSKLNAWVRVTSGTGPGGMVLLSNPNFQLFKGAGSNATGLYGNDSQSGTVGTTWSGGAINAGEGQGYRPSPIVSSLEVDEGAGNLSRKASFSITAHSKEQMEILTQYFLEPGYSVFLEWGWNTADGVSGLQGLNSTNISNFQSFVNTQKARETAKGDYDNYLGFMTGGSVSLDGDKWTITVNCTGYVELPAYLVSAGTGELSDTGDAKVITAPLYGTHDIEGTFDIGRQRFMNMFNLLPETRQTFLVKGLESELGVLENFINFDTDVSDKINKDVGSFIFGFFRADKEVDGENVEFPNGTKIISEDKFIRFSALMRIFNQIGVDGYEIGKKGSGKIIKFEVNTSETVCSAFPNIFSIDSSKLFIPNPETPRIKLGGITHKALTIKDLVSNSTPSDNSIGNIHFPNKNPYKYQPKVGNLIEKNEKQWGYLSDLYVNFDFAKNIMETKNFFVRDALYQLLNGLSSAVNGMWDFQMDESEVIDGVTQLKVFEMNLINGGQNPTPYTFDMIGEKSVFIDASLDLDISSDKMNRIIGSRLGAALNGDTSRIPKTLFSNREDLLGVRLKPSEDSPAPPKLTDDDKEALKEQNLNIILGKSKFFPKISLVDYSNVSGDLYDICYLGAFKDSTIFSSLKNDWNNAESKSKTVSPLMPINFSFKIHGVSGIKRGDMFRVNGIPDRYNDGFFQVLSVKHALDGMMWTTEVTGGYRQA